jgi:16S rRNA (cytosine1402-N4)-methyltransferase
MLAEILAALAPRPGEVVLDCTLGHGGHAEALARAAAPGGRVIGIDLDAEEQARTVQRLAQLGLAVSAHHTNFAGLGNVLKAEGLAGVDCLLADLGVSSMQLDRPERGFGFKHDGPLDMRMDRSRGKTAAELLAGADAQTIAGWLRDYGDEPRADAIADAVVRARPEGTRELAEIVLRAHGLDPRRFRKTNARAKHPAARVFQALRMVVNREAENLDALLRALPYVLNPGGRAAILTFHSGEETRVRRALEAAQAAGLLGHTDLAGLTPSRAEVHDNPRARSARLFTATRSAAM